MNCTHVVHVLRLQIPRIRGCEGLPTNTTTLIINCRQELSKLVVSTNHSLATVASRLVLHSTFHYDAQPVEAERRQKRLEHRHAASASHEYAPAGHHCRDIPAPLVVRTRPATRGIVLRLCRLCRDSGVYTLNRTVAACAALDAEGDHRVMERVEADFALSMNSGPRWLVAFSFFTGLGVVFLQYLTMASIKESVDGTNAKFINATIAQVRRIKTGARSTTAKDNNATSGWVKSELFGLLFSLFNSKFGKTYRNISLCETIFSLRSPSVLLMLLGVFNLAFIIVMFAPVLALVGVVSTNDTAMPRVFECVLQCRLLSASRGGVGSIYGLVLALLNFFALLRYGEFWHYAYQLSRFRYAHLYMNNFRVFTGELAELCHFPESIIRSMFIEGGEELGEPSTFSPPSALVELFLGMGVLLCVGPYVIYALAMKLWCVLRFELYLIS